MTDFSTLEPSTTLAIEVGGHFVLSLLVGFVIYFAYQKHFFRVITAALLVLFIDIDHFAPLINTFGGVKIFHNLLFVVGVPGLLMSYFYLKDRKTNDFSGVYTSSLFFVMLCCHIFKDGMDSTPVLLFYPFSTQSMMFSDMFTNMNMVNTMNLTMVSLMYLSAQILIIYQFVLRLKQKENRSESTDNTAFDTSVLWPVLSDDHTINTINTGSVHNNIVHSIQLCNTISRPRASNLF